MSLKLLHPARDGLTQRTDKMVDALTFSYITLDKTKIILVVKV